MLKIKNVFLAAASLMLIGASGTMAEKRTARAAETAWFTSADIFVSDDTCDEKYRENRGFICSGGIEVTGNRIWSLTFGGGPTEPHKDNYLALTFSDDRGVSWEKTYIIDNLTYPDETRLLDSEIWKDPQGKLWLFYTQTGGEGDLWGGANPAYPQASHAYVLENPTADPEDFKFTNKGMLIKGGRIFSKPIVVDHNGAEEWLVSSHVNWTEFTDVYSSVDRGETWTKKGSAKGTACGAHEAWIAELSDGTLMMQKRIDGGQNGGVELSYSSDKGATWSNYENNLGEPFVAPGSRMNLYRLASGNLLFIANASAAERTKLTVYMSADDGTTWPYKLLLDGRNGASYPDVTQTEDGTVYVCWDYARTTYAETRFSAFTEQDIINGEFSENCIYMRPVFKNNNYRQDVVRFERFGGIPEEFVYGTTHDEIAFSQLSEMTVFTSGGNEYEVTGSWSCPEFVQNKAGRYKFVFTPTNLPSAVEDVAQVLKVYVTVLEENQAITSSVEIASPPSKTTYKAGEELDLSGLVVKAKLSDGGKRTLKEDEYAVSGYDKDRTGEQTLTVTYQGKTAAFVVTVVGEDGKKEGGCGSFLPCGAGVIAAACAGGAVLKKRKKEV